jgi:hypothetical protein
MSELKKRLGFAEQQLRLLGHACDSLLSWMATYAPKGLEDLYDDARAGLAEALGDADEVAKREGLMHMIEAMSWRQAIAADRLEERVEAEAAAILKAFPDRSPEQLAVQVEGSSALHPGGPANAARVAQALRARQTRRLS